MKRILFVAALVSGSAFAFTSTTADSTNLGQSEEETRTLEVISGDVVVVEQEPAAE